MTGAQRSRGGVLEGIRILELADWVAGPFSTSILSDFGAEVIRIDLPGRVVNTRTLHGLEEADPERSPFFAMFAHNKKSITLDVRIPEGRAIFLELIAKTDVMVGAFRPGVLEKWGIGWDVLHEVKPSLIMLSVSGYGQTGPWSRRPGFDRVAQAFSGTTFLTGHEDAPPVRAGLSIADYAAGLWGVIGVLLATYERRLNGGVGQMIDQSLYEALLPMLCEIPMFAHRYGDVATRSGNKARGVSPGDTFVTADDRWVQISASGDLAWHRLATAMGRLDLLTDPRFYTNVSRYENESKLLPEIAAWARTLHAEELVNHLERAGVAAAMVQSVAELMAHPQVVARENFIEMEDPILGTLLAYSPLPRMSATPGRIAHPGPRLGEHNDEIYLDVLGIDPTRLKSLRESGAV